MRSRTDLLLLVAFCGFLLFYGLGAFGLLGADEPRYAQVAREMLDHSDWITPTLNGKPWLEKPPLYYWQAMLSFRMARTLLSAQTSNENNGATEKAARLPGAVDATIMVFAIYFFLRKLRPGSELDGALITASSAGIIGFAHAASTDMPLTATFTIAMLAWYAWYENQRKLNLALFYIFLALGTLAKGPVAPALAALVILIFLAAKREWGLLLRALWPPAIALFFAVVLPWYVAVQLRNPEFFRVFILEHNLARFSTNVYHHPQPFWFYLPVFLLVLMPWTLWLLLAIVERAREMCREGRQALVLITPDDSWELFLLLWMIILILFFSASQSKLPGYILPAAPAAALLITESLAARRDQERRISWPLAVSHGLLCGLLIFAALSVGAVALTTPHHLIATKGTYMAVFIGGMFALSIAATLLTRSGLRLLRPITMLAVVVGVAAVIRLAAPAIDATQSARPVAEIIHAFSHEPVPVALFHVGRTQQYGLDFYLNRATQTYETGQIPAEAHVLVAGAKITPELTARLEGRRVSYLTSVPAQKLELYWVGKL